MEARIEEKDAGGLRIEITGLKDVKPDGKSYIFSDIVEHCCKSLSTNELEEIVRQIERQLTCGCSACRSIRHDPGKCRKMLNEVKEVIRQRTDCAIIPSHDIRAMIERDSTSIDIEITGLKDVKPDGKSYIFSDIVEHCCKSLSTNELEEIVRQIERQLGRMNPRDIPPVYREMLNKVEEVMRKRTDKSEGLAYTYCHPCYHPCCYPRETTKREATSSEYLSPIRPCFGPNQVRCMAQLRKGGVYYCVHRHEEPNKTRFVITREPYLMDNTWWINAETDGSSGKYTTKYSLADASVIPYEDGQWNTWNHIIFGEPQRPSFTCSCCHP